MIRLLGMAMALACATAPAMAQAERERAVADIEPDRLSDTVLGEQRGGFFWRGLDIRFGADIRSYLNGEMVAQTLVNWTDATTDVQRVVSSTLTSQAAADLRSGLLSGGSLSASVGEANVLLANGGQTAFIQRGDGAIQNIILNTASNVDLRQQVDARLNIGGFAPFMNDILATRIESALSASGAITAVRLMPN